MAAPFKIGLTYFSHDCKMGDDPKMKLLLAKFGVAGKGLFDMLLEKIYDEKGYFWEATEDNILLLSRDAILDTSKVEEMIKYMIEKNLFDKDLFENYKILTSRRVQRTYIQGCSGRKKVILNRLFLLINPKEEKTDSVIFEDNPDNNGVNPEINEVNSDINPTKEIEMKLYRNEKEIKKKADLSDEEKTEIENIIKQWNLFATKHKLRIISKLKQEHLNCLQLRLSEKDFKFSDILTFAGKSKFLIEHGERGKPFAESWFGLEWIIKDEINYRRILDGGYSSSSAKKLKPGQSDFKYDKVYENN